MKKLFIVLMLLAAGFTKSMGQSMLKVSLRDNATQISVSVDDRHFNKRGTSITVGELPYGSHYLKIYAMEYSRRGRGYEEVIYEGRVKTYNGMITLFVFDPATGGNDIQEMEIDAYTANHPIAGKGRFSGSSRNEVNNGNNTNINNNNTAVNNTTTEPASPVASPVSEKFGTFTDSKFNQLKTKAAAKSTDTQKMGVLKDELKNEKVTTNQVADIMDLFIFEASKVEFAKWAYSITVDPEYFSDLESKFAYKASQDDLDKFIKEQPGH